MATEFFFNGRLIKQPGAYATIVSGQRNAPANLDYGIVVVIDTGGGANWGGGAGIAGTHATGKDAIYRFDNIEEYQFFLKGGPLWPVAEGLFRPDVNTAAVGVSEVLHVKAATTVPGTMTFTATGGGANGGTFQFTTRDEGFIANGQMNETRARSTLTITDPGDAADTATISINGVTVATYTVEAGDTIAVVRDGLIVSARAINLVNIISTETAGFVFTTVANQGDSADGTIPTTTLVGSVALTTSAFANGVDGDALSTGFAFSFRTGVADPAKWIMDINVGQFTGLHTDGIAFNGINAATSEPTLIVSSPEFNNIQDLIDWGESSTQFGRFFVFDSANSEVTGTGEVTNTDISSDLTYAVGGTETYATQRVDEILNALTDELFSFILTDIHGANVNTDADITKITTWMRATSKYERQLFIGAEDTEGTFPDSIDVATGFDNDLVIAVHGEVGFASQLVSSGYRIFDSLVHTSYVLGRTSGRPPQVPVTNKTLGVGMLPHNLTSLQKDRALDAGLLTSTFNQFINRIVVLQGVNTLQDNKVIFNNQGQSHQISFKRIVAQINMELIVNAEQDLLADELGVNANTLSAGMIKNFVETYLEARLATVDLDNLLLSYRNVVVTKVQDAWFVNYAIVVNNEVNKLFFTGFLFS